MKQSPVLKAYQDNIKSDIKLQYESRVNILKSYCRVRYLVECLVYSAFILESSINKMWIELLVFQTPDGNRFAKEIGLECGFI